MPINVCSIEHCSSPTQQFSNCFHTDELKTHMNDSQYSEQCMHLSLALLSCLQRLSKIKPKLYHTKNAATDEF